MPYFSRDKDKPKLLGDLEEGDTFVLHRWGSSPVFEVKFPAGRLKKIVLAMEEGKSVELPVRNSVVVRKITDNKGSLIYEEEILVLSAWEKTRPAQIIKKTRPIK